EVAPAPARVADTRHRLEHTQAERSEAVRAGVAATLRPALVAGHACPVCEQTVATLPAPLPGPDLAAAERAAA
ncbi:hypothetical protein, partial [Pseudonocardia aurantiaca]